MPPSDAKALYEQLVEYTRSQFENVQTGIFAADMKVHLINDGPVTFNLEVGSIDIKKTPEREFLLDLNDQFFFNKSTCLTYFIFYWFW